MATFIQGVTVGALVQGLPMRAGQYDGGPFGWFSPFACLCGVGLCLGYMMLGAGWLIAKCEGRIRDVAYRQLPKLALGVFGFLILAYVAALLQQLRIMDRWIERPYLTVFPAVGVLAGAVLILGVRRRVDLAPILATAVIFAAAFATLAASFWPYMIPFAINIDDGAAPPESLSFMFWGAGLIVIPLILTYTVIVYRVFRGKIVAEAVYE
ncbi:MAG: cytochrome d ubiquinol oxidase subunit II [Caulobacteraceae bacterium]